MKKLLFVIFLSFASNIGYSQDYGNKASALELCANMGSSDFGTDISAENALELILNTIGASKRFVLLPCENVNNASAFSLKGIRYIFYNKDFMQSIDSGNNWGNLFVLAHEVGHHINNHTLDFVLYATKTIGTITLKQKRQQEIEADEFAGFVLARLGGSLSEANQVISSISTNKDDSYSTHPSRNKRLNAVKIGYERESNKSIQKKYNSKEDIASEYFYKGYENNKKGDINTALSNYTVAISLNPMITSALNNRALIFMDKGLFKEALDDMNLAIKYKSNDAQYFDNRARIKMNLAESANDNILLESIGDLTTAISLDLEPNSYRYFQRGMCKYRYFGWDNACKDFVKAKSLGEDLPQYILSNLKEYECE
jgi:tetratricopeptide (TPR) repeat protein